jgi:hypothetical protein
LAVGDRGLTLIEAVIAAAVVLVVVIAASRAVATVDQSNVRGAARAAAEADVAAELENLRSLPFSGGDGAEGADVLSCVFPHADPGRNSPDAAYQAEAQAGCPAGTFVTVKHAACGTETIAATFVVSTPDGFVPVAVARLAGYDARQARVLPGAALLVRVALAFSHDTHGGVVTRTELIADRPDTLCSAAPTSAVAQ